MNIHQPQPKSHSQPRVLKPVDINANNPSTPVPNKTYRGSSPATGIAKHQHKPKTIYLSPSSLAPYYSPKSHHIAPKLKQAIQTPCSHGAINPHSRRNAENKALSPNSLASKEAGLHYIPTNVNKKPSPRPNKALDLQKLMAQNHKKGGDFSISSTKMAARMKPDRCSTDHLKLHEISSKRQVMTLGDVGRMDEKPIVEINLSPHAGDLMTNRAGLSQIGQGIEMNLSPISKLKEDLSSFLSDKEKQVCIRHPRKKAKYRARYEEPRQRDLVENFYCSECAVELAMRGVQIEKLPMIGLHTRTNTECDERQDTEEHIEDPEVISAVNEFRSKLGEMIQEVDGMESKYLDYKETTEIKVELTRETIQMCSENVIVLFKEETNKTINGLNTEMNQRMQSIEVYLNQLKDFYKGFIDIKQDFEEGFQQSVHRLSRKSAHDTIQDYHRRINEIKNKFNKTTQPAQEIENSCFEAKINDYKKGLKAVLKEVINELERDEATTIVSEKAEQPTMTQSITDENMLKKLGAFEDFLRADESQDALQMRIAKPKMGENMVISFGSKEVFDNVLHTTPHEGLTICSTQGETMVLPSLDELTGGFRIREERNCVTEPNLYDKPRKGAIHEDYGKFMNYIESKINDENERERDGSFQKALFHSPEFKSNDDEAEHTGVVGIMDNYYNY